MKTGAIAIGPARLGDRSRFIALLGKRTWTFLLIAALLPVLAKAQDPPKTPAAFNDSFETGYLFFDDGVGVLHVRQSGSTAETDYAPGISASDGHFYARVLVQPWLQNGGQPPSVCPPVPFTLSSCGINGDQSNGTCRPGATTGDNSFTCDGPFTEWGLPFAGFDGKAFACPAGPCTGIPIKEGALTSIDIYLDTTFAAPFRTLGGTTDYRFDWDSDLLDSQGMFLQDYIFNVAAGLNNGSTTNATYTNDTCGGKVPASGGFYVVEASTNSQRGANAHNPTPPNPPQVCISKSGWYTFRHVFRPDHSNNLEVDMTILDSSHHVVASWALHPTCMGTQISEGFCTTGAPLPFSAVGSNFLGWFPDQEISDLAIDNVHRRPNDEDDREGER